MGTRADFYVGRGVTAEWLGSVSMDGYPGGINCRNEMDDDGSRSPVLTAQDEQTYRKEVTAFLASQHLYATLPEIGWPWPWEDSRTTDYAYAFDGGTVWASCFGAEWFKATEEQPDQEDAPQFAVFPNMKTDRAAKPGSDRSGIMVIGLGGPP